MECHRTKKYSTLEAKYTIGKGRDNAYKKHAYSNEKCWNFANFFIKKIKVFLILNKNKNKIPTNLTGI